MLRKFTAVVAALFVVGAARASTWWATYDGNDFPENEGWVRFSSNPPAQRWLQDGCLFIDSRADWNIYDQYAQPRPGQMTLAPGQTFEANWRLKVDEEIPTTDLSVDVESDDGWEVALDIYLNGVHSVFEAGSWAPFEPNQFHEFGFQSSDFRTYTLTIDGSPGLQGTFSYKPFQNGGIGWGDMSTAKSLSEWDYFDCGIVPEPAGLLCALGALSALYRPRGFRPAHPSGACGGVHAAARIAGGLRRVSNVRMTPGCVGRAGSL